MFARPTVFVVVLIASLLAVIPASAKQAQPRETLRGEVGPGFTIFLRHADGTAVTHLDPGEYAIVVQDNSVEHNFHLFGAGVEQSTAVETTGSTTWTVTFADGQVYRYQCDPHSTTMRGSFTVGTVQQPPPAPATGRLSATVTSRAIAVRTSSGARARTVRAGSYRISVRDTAKNRNFHLIGPGVNRKTSIRGTARATWSLRLRPGTYRYRSDAGRLRGSFRVVS